jgi:hypothetical protein
MECDCGRPYGSSMGMDRRQSQEKQEEVWIANAELARSPGYLFYQRLNELLDGEKFDHFLSGLCGKFYAAKMGRPGLVPGIYFRALLMRPLHYRVLLGAAGTEGRFLTLSY